MRHRGATYGVLPRPGELGADVVGDAAHRGVDPGPLHLGGRRHRGPRRPGQRAAVLAEVEVQPLERVGPEPRQPGGDRPAGRPAGAEPGRGGRPRRPRAAPRRRRRTPPPARRRGPCWRWRACRSRTPLPSRLAASLMSASSLVRVAFLALTRLAISSLQRVHADAVPGADRRAPGPRRARRGRAGGVRRPASRRAGPRAPCRCG